MNVDREVQSYWKGYRGVRVPVTEGRGCRSFEIIGNIQTKLGHVGNVCQRSKLGEVNEGNLNGRRRTVLSGCYPYLLGVERGSSLGGHRVEGGFLEFF